VKKRLPVVKLAYDTLKILLILWNSHLKISAKVENADKREGYSLQFYQITYFLIGRAKCTWWCNGFGRTDFLIIEYFKFDFVSEKNKDKSKASSTRVHDALTSVTILLHQLL
jgi:hypothetical protein